MMIDDGVVTYERMTDDGVGAEEDHEGRRK